jgi:hypothetical protein
MARLRVHFIHGLEGSPQGSKARALAAEFETTTPAMDTRNFEACVAQHAETIRRFRPDVLAGRRSATPSRWRCWREQSNSPLPRSRRGAAGLRADSAGLRVWRCTRAATTSCRSPTVAVSRMPWLRAPRWVDEPRCTRS